MPRAKKVPEPELQEELEQPEPTIDELLDEGAGDVPGFRSLDDELQEFLSEVGGEEGQFYVDTYRYNAENQLEYCSRFQAGEFDLEELRKRHGGGRYVCRARVRGNPRARSRTVRVEGAPKALAKGGPSDQEREERNLVEKVLDTQAALQEALRDLRNPPRAAEAQDPMVMALSMVGAIQQLIQPWQQALLTKNDQGPSFDKFIDAFSRGMDFARDMGQGDGNGSGGYGEVIRSLGLPLLQQLQEQGSKERTAAPQLNPAPTRAPQLPPGSSAAARPAWDLLVGSHLNQLQALASQHKSPELYAQVLADQLPQKAEDLLVPQLERGGEFLAEWFTLHPETRAFEGWYRELFSELSAIYLFDETDPGADPPPTDQEEG